GPVTDDVYAVKRGKGPWRDLYAPTGVIASQAVCNGQGPGHLRMVYNANDQVEAALSTLDLEPLACHALLASSGGAQSWGSEYNDWCSATDETWSDIPDSVAAWVQTIIACEGEAMPNLTYGYETVGFFGGSGPNGSYVVSDVA